MTEKEIATEIVDAQFRRRMYGADARIVTRDGLIHAIAQALALARAEGSPQGWQEIASAPKDERRVLLFNPDEMHGWEFQTGAYYEQLGGWQYDGQTPAYSNAHQPTHYMPLPAPPAPGSAEEER